MTCYQPSGIRMRRGRVMRTPLRFIPQYVNNLDLTPLPRAPISPDRAIQPLCAGRLGIGEIQHPIHIRVGLDSRPRVRVQTRKLLDLVINPGSARQSKPDLAGLGRAGDFESRRSGTRGNERAVNIPGRKLKILRERADRSHEEKPLTVVQGRPQHGSPRVRRRQPGEGRTSPIIHRALKGQDPRSPSRSS
jgi:hypothetical protein